jgi:Holliday junction resolvase RusA-like endonuclease
MSRLVLNLEIEPKAVQSFRMTRTGHRYQPADVVNYKRSLQLLAGVQLPGGFQLFKDMIRVDVAFIFKMTGKLIKEISKKPCTKEFCYKPTRPDLDNLTKGTLDAFNGMLWIDDSLICDLHVAKYYRESGGGIVLTVGSI